MPKNPSYELNGTICKTTSVPALLKLTKTKVHDMNSVNVVTSLQRLIKMSQRSNASPRLDASQVAHIFDRGAECFAREKCQARHVAGALWACAKLRAMPAGMVRAALRSGAGMQAAWFKPQELSMCTWAIGKLCGLRVPNAGADAGPGRMASRLVWGKLLPSALSRAGKFSSQALANLVQGLAATPAPALASLPSGGASAAVGRLLVALRGRLGECRPQEIANTLAGLAKLEARLDDCDGLAAEAGAALRAKLPRLTPQNLAVAARATTKLMVLASREETRQALDFWRLFATPVRSRVQDLNAQELAMCTWAASKSLSLSTAADPDTVAAVTSALAEAAVLPTCLAGMDAQQIATVTLALTKLGCTDRGTLKGLSKAARNIMPSFGAQDLDNLAYGFARHELCWRSRKLVAALATAGTATIARGHEAFPPRNLANFLSAVAKLARLAQKKRHKKEKKAKEKKRKRKGDVVGGEDEEAAAAAAEREEATGDGTRALSDAAGRVITHASSSFLASSNLTDLANAAWGLAVMGHASSKAPMLAIATRAATVLGTSAFSAQECSRLLCAVGLSGVHCPELERAAGAERDLDFEFGDADVPHRALRVTLKMQLGGTQQQFARRESTGAIAGNGGALFADSFVLADWLARQRSLADAAASIPGAERVAAALKLAGQRESGKEGGWAGATLVELGAGLGLVSIVAQRMGMRVVATDGDASVLAQLEANAGRNRCLPTDASSSSSYAAGAAAGAAAAAAASASATTTTTALRSALLKWGAASPKEALGLRDRHVDVLVATGCVYGRDVGVWQSLVQTLVDLSGPNTIILLAHGTGAAPGIHQLRGAFYEMCEEHFEVWRTPQHMLHADHPGCQVHVLARRRGGGAAGGGEGGKEEEKEKKKRRRR